MYKTKPDRTKKMKLHHIDSYRQQNEPLQCIMVILYIYNVHVVYCMCPAIVQYACLLCAQPLYSTHAFSVPSHCTVRMPSLCPAIVQYACLLCAQPLYSTHAFSVPSHCTVRMPSLCPAIVQYACLLCAQPLYSTHAFSVPSHCTVRMPSLCPAIVQYACLLCAQPLYSTHAFSVPSHCTVCMPSLCPAIVQYACLLCPSKKTYKILSRISKNLIRTSFLIRKRVRNCKRRKILNSYKIPTRFLQETYRNV